MKEFVVYTLERLLLLAAAIAICLAIWLPTVGNRLIPVPLVIAVLVSAVGSYVLLRGPRERFAARVEQRASRMTQKFEEMRAKEDED